MRLVVVTPHTDDFIYGLGGTLFTHADDDIHIVAVSSVQQSAARDVAGRRRQVRTRFPSSTRCARRDTRMWSTRPANASCTILRAIRIS